MRASALPANFVTLGDTLSFQVHASHFSQQIITTSNQTFALSTDAGVVAFSGRRVGPDLPVPDLSPYGMAVTAHSIVCTQPGICPHRKARIAVTAGAQPLVLEEGQTGTLGPFLVTATSVDDGHNQFGCDNSGAVYLFGYRP